MTKISDIYAFLDEKVPFSIQESWDNSGLLVGHPEQEIDHIFVSLDITEDTVAEAIASGAQLMVSHHPVIFRPAKRITADDPDGRILLTMIEHGIGAICCHTNLDSVRGGVNDVLAGKLGLTVTDILDFAGNDPNGLPCGVGRVGELAKAMELGDFLRVVKEQLGSNGIRYASAGKPVQRVAVGGGACGDMVDNAIALGCDTFVTSDLKYNAFLSAAAKGINLIDAGHFPTEQPVTEVLVQWLSEAFPAVKITKSAVIHEVISYI